MSLISGSCSRTTLDGGALECILTEVEKEEALMVLATLGVDSLPTAEKEAGVRARRMDWMEAARRERLIADMSRCFN